MADFNVVSHHKFREYEISIVENSFIFKGYYLIVSKLGYKIFQSRMKYRHVEENTVREFMEKSMRETIINDLFNVRDEKVHQQLIELTSFFTHFFGGTVEHINNYYNQQFTLDTPPRQHDSNIDGIKVYQDGRYLDTIERKSWSF